MSISEKLDDINKKLDDIKETLEKLRPTCIELKQFSSKLTGEGNEKAGQEVNKIVEKIKYLIEKRDSDNINLFFEKLKENQATILKEINKSEASTSEKEKAKKGLSSLILPLTKDVSLGVAVSWISTYLSPVMIAGSYGALVPAIILGILISIGTLSNQKMR
jgi:hypothetical protein